MATRMNTSAMSDDSIYEGFEKKENGTLRDPELVNDSVQKVILSEAKVGTKYTIQMGFRKKPVVPKVAKAPKEPKEPKEPKAKAKSSSIPTATKTFEEMMARFEQMVQMNQMIQMNQMTQMQMMSQLLELKANVVETRQDLGHKLKELDHKVDMISTSAAAAAAAASAAASASSRHTTTSSSSAGVKKSPKQLVDSIAAVIGEMEEAEEEIAHLTRLHKESGQSIMQLREIDDEYIKALIKAKTTTSFVKAFDYLYRSKDQTKRDVYPIRVIKAKTFQYLNREGKWILDTNGTKMMEIICSNIEMLLTKINNQFFEEEEFDVNDFVDNQAFIGLLDESKIKTQILNHIRDGVLNHTMLSK